ncbi:TRAP-type transport system, periplasmic component, predicted N-acetylneuraminate-binding protein [Azospirillum argentinense]|uniref:ABC transporter substrate-binding protein n=2 Tax=Azospirillum TaxID=191 RepID=A0A5B0KWS3_9PROT|nr:MULTISPECIES: TRAP transporter substrate-binding protein [Azospirillum]AIB14628.1 ABC transporter substrate-binding protein [Azospirillum argentinense]EZQ05190.1 ABC transporter substrate-binding protein [Azospirillum argentinense]KAA1055920.1 TRAP-type transport system, periplasmic component, predicted N-acetylneuraminate-binding protein [Azospirillum argentinense]MBK3800028.1 DctP family TRAP transporter solute-binding subunit [Azospirillum argentinense]NUB28061.1 DctP family TRAP transpo
MKLLRSVLLATGLAAAILAPVAASAQDIKPRLIRFGYGLSESSNQGRAVKFFVEEMSKRSGGKLKVKGFADASLGSDIQMQNALIGGAQEMMVGSTATLVGIVKDFAVFDLPFLFNNEQEADAVFDGPFGQKLAAKLNDKGLVGLVYWENGFRNLTNSKRPVEKVEDLKGIKLRVMQNPVYIDMFNGFGANAVPLSFSELFTAMETGTVDGQENPVTTIQSSKFYEVQKYLTISKHVYSPWIVLASKRWYDGLSNDERKIINEAAVASRDFERKDSREASKQSIAYLKDKGMQINELSDAELGRMREMVKPAMDKFAADGGADLLNELQGEINKVRK